MSKQQQHQDWEPVVFNKKPAAKTEEEIKRERRWKNENKSKTVHPI